MKVDIYRREEPRNMFSYLIVPQGKDIPAEADNVDWHVRHLAIDVDESQEHLHPYEIDHPRVQIAEKGYAITSVYHQVPAQAAP
jgi:hypothetical protein